jgi:hypothetical protein
MPDFPPYFELNEGLLPKLRPYHNRIPPEMKFGENRGRPTRLPGFTVPKALPTEAKQGKRVGRPRFYVIIGGLVRHVG